MCDECGWVNDGNAGLMEPLDMQEGDDCYNAVDHVFPCHGTMKQ